MPLEFSAGFRARNTSVAHLLDRGLGVPAADAILTRVADEIFTLL